MKDGNKQWQKLLADKLPQICCQILLGLMPMLSLKKKERRKKKTVPALSNFSIT